MASLYVDKTILNCLIFLQTNFVCFQLQEDIELVNILFGKMDITWEKAFEQVDKDKNGSVSPFLEDIY